MNEEKDVLELFDQAKPLFIALGDENRQQIVYQLLQTHKLSVNTIADISSLSRPAISHHLKILKDTGLVDIERRGTQRFYSLSEQAVLQLDLLDDLTAALRACTKWHDN